MDKNDIIKGLKKHKKDLHQKDVTHAVVFGSYAQEQKKTWK